MEITLYLQVLTRTRIVMRDDIGRQMLGVMDETGTLDYGQVFVQYSRDIAVPGVGTRYNSYIPSINK